MHCSPKLVGSQAACQCGAFMKLYGLLPLQPLEGAEHDFLPHISRCQTVWGVCSTMSCVAVRNEQSAAVRSVSTVTATCSKAGHSICRACARLMLLLVDTAMIKAGLALIQHQHDIQ